MLLVVGWPGRCGDFENSHIVNCTQIRVEGGVCPQDAQFCGTNAVTVGGAFQIHGTADRFDLTFIGFGASVGQGDVVDLLLQLTALFSQPFTT